MKTLVVFHEYSVVERERKVRGEKGMEKNIE